MRLGVYIMHFDHHAPPPPTPLSLIFSPGTADNFFWVYNPKRFNFKALCYEMFFSLFSFSFSFSPKNLHFWFFSQRSSPNPWMRFTPFLMPYPPYSFSPCTYRPLEGVWTTNVREGQQSGWGFSFFNSFLTLPRAYTGGGGGCNPI